MGPESKGASFIYSDEDCVEQILSIHQQVPITVRVRTLRIERVVNRPYSISSGTSGNAVEPRKYTRSDDL